MRTKLLAFVSAAAILTALFVPFAATAHADPDTNGSTANCIGVERGIRNRNGGDRAHGVFGPPQAEVVKAEQPYGQFLQRWKVAKC